MCMDVLDMGDLKIEKQGRVFGEKCEICICSKQVKD